MSMQATFAPTSGLNTAFSRDFKKESWALYGIGIAAVVLRSIARIRRMGVRGLQSDDYLILFAAVWYTVLCVALNEIIIAGGSNLLTADDIRKLTPETKARRSRGAKWVFVGEHAMVMTLWTLKTCMIILYHRIMEGLSQERLVKYLTVWVALGFIGTELSLFLICRPLHNYWTIPPPPEVQCSSYQLYGILQGIFAISADVLMLAIAIPLFLSLRLPKKQKLILLFVFGMGIFVVIAAVLTKLYCLVPWLISYVYMNWYLREATVGILVTCLPMTWSLLRDLFPMLTKWASATSGLSGTTTSSGTTRYGYGGSRSYGRNSRSNNSNKTASCRLPSWCSSFHQHKDHMQLDDFNQWRSGLQHLPTIDDGPKDDAQPQVPV
ncbi:hypothetical protein MferCBS31731_006023 [Microsporum ferrugineum]